MSDSESKGRKHSTDDLDHPTTKIPRINERGEIDNNSFINGEVDGIISKSSLLGPSVQLVIPPMPIPFNHESIPVIVPTQAQTTKIPSSLSALSSLPLSSSDGKPKTTPTPAPTALTQKNTKSAPQVIEYNLI